jgi:predicted Zn-dependent protease
MRNLFIQGVLIVAAFLGVYFALSQIDYIGAFHIKEATDTTEEKLGDLFWETIKKIETVIKNDSVNRAVDKIVTRIAQENNIDRETIKVHIIKKDEINAFAMPNRYLIIYSGLIDAADNESELAGVISHEMAHIEKNHVMKKLVKELGLSMLLSITTGGKTPELAGEAAKMLSSTAYDRDLESEADLTGADYMIKAHLDPAEMADFLYKMSTDEALPERLYWISTHPESKARAEAIIHYIKGEKFDKKPVLTKKEWKYLKENSNRKWLN